MPGRPLTGDPRMALFGKLPAHGDFIRRGEGALVRRLDLWLTGEIERLAMAEDDLDARLSTLPTWCFRLPGDVAGALVASHDKVGRVFPLVACVDTTIRSAERAADALTQARDGGIAADAVAEELRRIKDEARLAWPDPDAADADVTIDARWWVRQAAGQPVLALPDLPTGADFARLLRAEG